ncbi:MAG: hypothetical protein ABJZ55_13290 [Fuerstiella sp.]
MLQRRFDQFSCFFVKLPVFGFESAKSNSVMNDTFVVTQELRYSVVSFGPMVFGFLAVRSKREINQFGAAFKRIWVNLLASNTDKRPHGVKVDVKDTECPAADVWINFG